MIQDSMGMDTMGNTVDTGNTVHRAKAKSSLAGTEQETDTREEPRWM